MNRASVVTVPETASWLHRIGALCLDWAASTLVVILLIGGSGWSADPLAGFYTMGVFLMEATVLTALAGGSFGKLATGLRVVRTDGRGAVLGRPVDLLRALLRQVLVCLAVPPLVFRPDGRGLHDMSVGTMTVRVADLAAARGTGR